MTAALAGKALLFLGCTALGVLRGRACGSGRPVSRPSAGFWRLWPGSWPSPCALWTS